MFARAGWPLLFKVQRYMQICAPDQFPRNTARSSQMVEQAWRCLPTPFHHPFLLWGLTGARPVWPCCW